MALVTSLVNKRPVVIFSKSSCCMCHTIKTLISNFGANPTVYELDEHPDGKQLEKELRGLGCKPSVPAVFIGEDLIGGANEIMSLHLKGQLVQLLLKANAIWTLISNFGANPTVYELDEHPDGKQLEKELRGLGCNPSVPAVFIGEELIGGANEIMSLHLKGQLVQLLLKANAIWV
ncbi:hypothetical protein E3N88_33722 [Mikania micrantha]|uniref:Glutaredoxin domain-containing protein n=1 Tax=Mikania micrantha TaxID=192012 RepID=A0A5N6MDE9_9ASTR|nr:hypothetical protein E3N88_33722 [Mikania micrantha]